jgi:cyanate lyase
VDRDLDRLTAGRLVAHRRRGLGVAWQAVADTLDRGLAWTVAAVLGQHPLTARQAAAVGDLLELEADLVEGLTLPPVRGEAAVDTSEPVVYRLQEMVQVYGSAISELIAEQFGDGIMSAIDFELEFERRADPKGDRVVLTLNGKFLPYRVF